MAIDYNSGISSLDSGALDIKYTGDEGPKSPNQIAGGEYNRVLELLEKVRENIPLSEEEKMELQGLIKTLTAKGINVESLMREDTRMASADPMLQDEYDKYVFELQEMHPEARPMSIEEFKQQAISGMAEGGRAGFRGGGADYMPLPEGPRGNPPVIKEIEDMREFRIANPDIEDITDYEGYYERLRRKKLQEMMRRRPRTPEAPWPGGRELLSEDIGDWEWGSPDLTEAEKKDTNLLLKQLGLAYGGTARPTYTQKRKQNLAYGGIAGLDGRRQYGLGSWFQEKVMDPIKEVAKPVGEKIRKIIPNELADIAVKTAPFVAMIPGQQGTAAAMRGIGRYDERGDVGDALKQAALTYGGGKLFEAGMGKITGGIDKAIEQEAQPLGYMPDPAGEIVPGDVASGALNEWGDPVHIPGTGTTITKAIPRPTDIISGGTGTGDGWLYNLGQGAKNIAEGIGGTIGAGVGALGTGIGALAGGAGNVVKKGLETIIPGGETGYGDIYGGIGDLAGSIFGTPVSGAERILTGGGINPVDRGAVDAILRGSQGVKKDTDLPFWRKALATILPGGDPGFDLGSQIFRSGTDDQANWLGPVTMGLGIGALDAATRKPDMMPQDTSGIDIANIRSRALTGSDPGLHFLPPASATTAYAKGGRTGYYAGNMVEQKENIIKAFSAYKNQGGIKDFRDWFSGEYLPEMPDMARRPDEVPEDPWAEGAPYGYAEPGTRGTISIGKMAQGGRIGAQEGGLMDLGGMEKDYRQEGGFVPIGGQERADDVPARLSKNEFVFTADAVRAAGGGDIDKGAEVMENVMNNLEQGGQVSEESQGLEGARNMFATAQRLEGVL